MGKFMVLLGLVGTPFRDFFPFNFINDFIRRKYLHRFSSQRYLLNGRMFICSIIIRASISIQISTLAKKIKPHNPTLLSLLQVNGK